MKQSAHTRIGYVGVLLCALISFSPVSAYADYTRTPSGLTVYQDDGYDLHYDLSGFGTGFYFSFFDSATIGTCTLVTSDPQSIDVHISSPSLGARTEILGARYSDSGCTSYTGSASLEYNAGATIFTVVSGSAPTPDDTTATSSPDSYPEILAFSFFLAFAGFIFPFLIVNVIDRGY